MMLIKINTLGRYWFISFKSFTSATVVQYNMLHISWLHGASDQIADNAAALLFMNQQTDNDK